MPNPEGVVRSRESWRKTRSLRQIDTTSFRHRNACDAPSASSHFSVGSFSSARSLIFQLWIIFWLTVVPLFHAHIPDTTDEWSAVHSGGVHTVFTPDLPGEFAPPVYEKHRDHPGHFTHRAVNSPE